MYAHRFSDADARRKLAVWRELTRWLQRYVPLEAAVLDLACDRGAFINQIRAAERWAVDVRDVRQHLDPGVRFVQSDGLSLREVMPAKSMDVVFVSNYLEHLPSADVVIEQLKVVFDLLKPGGRAIVLQPNIRLTGAAYWDFLDHRTALTDKSLEEAGRTAGFQTEELVTRFIPYTTKSRFPQNPWIVRAYLALRPLWPVFGQQSLYVARKPAAAE
ncbi:MAG: class I SAM-dependent methyltransferase [Chloroflexi bacterium]|nr:MAG: class I SAM-dependent methyltransferase [Chloroflexota bacterium]